MVKRILTVLAALVLLGAAPALAQYDNDDDAATVGSTTVAPGGNTTVSGCGFKADSEVTLKLVNGETTTTLGTEDAGTDGCVSTTATIPTDVLGVVILRLEGVDPSDNARVLDASITVSDTLAATGTESSGLGSTGAVLIGAGVLLVIAATRFRRNATVDA